MNIEHFKQKLTTLRAETLEALEQSKESSQAVELDQTTQGRLSRIDAIQQQEMALSAKRRRELLLTQIDNAFKRIEHNDYGFCIKCGEEIAEKRLEFDPVILTCVDCA